jgi:hypothetical protein
MSRFYPRYCSREKLLLSLDHYLIYHNIEIEEELKEEILDFLVRRIKAGPKYEISEDDTEVLNKITNLSKEEYFSFERDFLMEIKKRNYVLERYEEGEINFSKISEQQKELFENTDEVQKQLENIYGAEDWKYWTTKKGCEVFKRKYKESNYIMIKSTKSFKTSWDYREVARFCFEVSIVFTQLFSNKPLSFFYFFVVSCYFY